MNGEPILQTSQQLKLRSLEAARFSRHPVFLALDKTCPGIRLEEVSPFAPIRIWSPNVTRQLIKEASS